MFIKFFIDYHCGETTTNSIKYREDQWTLVPSGTSFSGTRSDASSPVANSIPLLSSPRNFAGQSSFSLRKIDPPHHLFDRIHDTGRGKCRQQDHRPGICHERRCPDRLLHKRNIDHHDLQEQG